MVKKTWDWHARKARPRWICAHETRHVTCTNMRLRDTPTTGGMRRFENHNSSMSRSAFSNACTIRSTDRSEDATSSCRRSGAERRRTRRRTIQANIRFERTFLSPPRDDLSSHARLTDARATLRRASEQRTNAFGVGRNSCVEVHPNANAYETRATNGDTNPAKTNANETRRSPICHGCG